VPLERDAAEADVGNRKLNLHERTYYLAQALTNAKSAASVGVDDVEFTTALQERIDVAQVQMEVERAIELHGEMTDEEKSYHIGMLQGDLLGLDTVSLGSALGSSTGSLWLTAIVVPGLCETAQAVRVDSVHTQDGGYETRRCMRGGVETAFADA
jgi:hypothetical protein